MKKKYIITTALITTVLSLCVFFSFLDSSQSEKTTVSMDTVVTVKVKGKNSDEAAGEILDIVKTLDSKYLSRFSEKSMTGILNREKTVTDSELAGFLLPLISLSEKSNGRFDFTLSPLSDLWSFTSDPRIPKDSEIKAALQNTGYKNVVLNGDTVTITDENVSVDFGSAGKGIALDKIREYCDKKSSIKRVVASVGGSILCRGKGTFTVGIKKPGSPGGEILAALTLKECCVSTSGSYERFFEEDGRIYHHILDPKTGYPVDNGLVSTTLVGESGILSDALATACFAAGIEKGAALAAEYNFDAVFVDNQNTVYITPNLRNSITVSDGYSLVVV
ncbi:MAG: FAD:protein FMN transferase [Clostridiales bacterium]|nr:FAD:protein FMN transferase [Clostridiales bacterium]